MFCFVFCKGPNPGLTSFLSVRNNMQELLCDNKIARPYFIVDLRMTDFEILTFLLAAERVRYIVGVSEQQT